MKITLTLISFLGRGQYFSQTEVLYQVLADGSLKKSALLFVSQIPC